MFTLKLTGWPALILTVVWLLAGIWMATKMFAGPIEPRVFFAFMFGIWFSNFWNVVARMFQPDRQPEGAKP